MFAFSGHTELTTAAQLNDRAALLWQCASLLLSAVIGKSFMLPS